MSYEIKVAFHPYVTMLQYYFQTKEKIRDTLFTFELNSVDLSSFWRIFLLNFKLWKLVKLCLRSSYKVQNSLLFDGFLFQIFASGITK